MVFSFARLYCLVASGARHRRGQPVACFNGALKPASLHVRNPTFDTYDDVTLNDTRFLKIIEDAAETLKRYQLKIGFCEGAPPAREALADHEAAFAVLLDRPWSQMGPADGPLLIEVLPYLSDKEFLSALPPILEFLLRADRRVAVADLFLLHLRDISKSHVHRILPHDVLVLMGPFLTAMESKFGDVKQETAANFRKTREWFKMRSMAKKDVGHRTKSD
jgi:hypothetical protein